MHVSSRSRGMRNKSISAIISTKVKYSYADSDETQSSDGVSGATSPPGVAFAREERRS
jgi:hypothetical protein